MAGCTRRLTTGLSGITGMLPVMQDPTACRCAVHARPRVVERQGCGMSRVGTHPVVVAASEGKHVYCHATESVRWKDWEFQSLCEGEVDVPAFESGEVLPAAVHLGTSTSTLQEFGRGYCHFVAFYSTFYWRLARVLGPTPYILDVMRALRVAGRKSMKPLKLVKVCDGLYHVVKDSSVKGMVSDAGSEFYSKLEAVVSSEPEARVGMERSECGQVDVSSGFGVVYPVLVGPVSPEAKLAWDRSYVDLVFEYYRTVRAVGTASGLSVGSSSVAEECAERESEVCADRVVVPGVLPVCAEQVVGGPAQPVVLRGKNYESNKRKRERAKALRAAAARGDLSGAGVGGVKRAVDKPWRCPSLVSVRTADTRTVEEVEASRTYAMRRAAENKVAEAKAKFQLASYADPDRVKAHKRLEAVRYAQRINEANAKSQASYKKCDQSLKSLGSSGSAGELLLKQQVKQAQEDARMLKYAEEQLKYTLQFVPPEGHRHLAEMDPPQFESAHEIFGDCPDDYDDDEREAYYRDLDQIDAEAAIRTARC